MNNIRDNWRRKDGFTLTEISAASAILIIAITMSLSGFIYALKAAHQGDVQDELDVEVQKAMESLKKNLRLSSIDKMVYYPSGSGPYTGISFPLARDDDGDGAIETNAAGKIDWDKTLVYHVWLSDPDELRITTFDPRDNSLTEGERQTQLEKVVAGGSATNTLTGISANSTNSSMRSIFENVFTWSISPQGSTYNGYDASESRDENVLLGTKVLSGGDHTFKFTVEGQDSDSSGHKIGLDTLFVTPSGDEFEAEYLLPQDAYAGPFAPKSQYKSGGSWSGNFQLLFLANATGQYFTLTIPNDCWEEANFRSTGEKHDNTTVEFDTSLSPDDYVVKLDGNDTSWKATDQTGDQTGSNIGLDRIRDMVFRVVMRGSEMESGNWFQYEGGKVKVKMKAATTGKLGVDGLYIAQCADSNSPSPNTVGPQVSLLSAAMTINAGASAWSDTVDFEINKDLSYSISFHIANGLSFGNGYAWEEQNAPSIAASYVIPTGGGAGHPAIDDWITFVGTNNFFETNRVVCLEELFTTYPTNGIFTSRIFDTILADPSYDTADWDITLPHEYDGAVRVRSGDASDMSDAPAWSAVAATFDLDASPADISSAGSGRYVQFQVMMEPCSSGGHTPALGSMEIEWDGEDRIANIGGTFTQGPDYGIFKLEIDGEEMVSGLRINLEIYEDTYGYGGTRRITSSLTSEIQPRNTGK